MTGGRHRSRLGRERTACSGRVTAVADGDFEGAAGEAVGDGSVSPPTVLQCPIMTCPLRALASVVVGIATVVGIVVYEHYSIDEPPSDSFTAAVATAAALLTWLVTALD